MKNIRPRITPLPAGLSPQDPAALIATGFGSGRISPAPGTWGTLAAWGLGLLLPHALLPVAVLLACAAGWWAVTRFQTQSGTHDAGMIVIDEWAGVWIAMAFAAPQAWDQLALAFVLFRLFDIMKPWPICWIDQRVNGASGVMLDDLLAGLWAGLCIYGYQQWIN